MRWLRFSIFILLVTLLQASNLLDWIAVTDLSIKPDLLVIGSHRRQILREVFVGTTAERTIRTAVCPVLMVNASPTTNYQHIMRTSALTGLVGINTPFDPPTQGSTQTCHRCEGIGQDQNKNVV